MAPALAACICAAAALGAAAGPAPGLGADAALARWVAALEDGVDEAPRARLKRIITDMAPTFQAAPKNMYGRLTLPGVGFLLREHFARAHRWQLAGLESHGWPEEWASPTAPRPTALAAAAARLGERRAGRGLSLDDVAVLAARLEEIIDTDSDAALDAARRLAGAAAGAALPADHVRRVLAAYFFTAQHLVNETDGASISQDAVQQPDTEEAPWFDAEWSKAVDAALEADPAADGLHAPESVARLARAALERFTEMERGFCGMTQTDLAALGTRGAGLVSLARFYGHASSAGNDFEFDEAAEYLRAVGALDERSSSYAQVRIANYLMGPSNCAAHFPHFSICCPSACGALMGELERSVKAPSAAADDILRAVGRLAISATRAPQPVPEGLAQSLRDVADAHDGEVPLHGRQFAEWMHAAFPNECPHPRPSENVGALIADYWGEAYPNLTPEERAAYVAAATPEELAAPAPQPRARAAAWAHAAAHGLLLVAMASALTRALWRAMPAAAAPVKGKGAKAKVN